MGRARRAGGGEGEWAGERFRGRGGRNRLGVRDGGESEEKRKGM